MSAVGTKAYRQQVASGPCPFLHQRTHHELAVGEAFGPNDPLLQQDLLADKYLFIKSLLVCSKEKALDKGRSIHALATVVGFDSDAAVATAVLNVYGKCGILEDAHKTFDGLHKKDVVAWNAIIGVCAHHGLGAECLQFYADLHQKCIIPDKFTCVSMLSACASLEDCTTGQHIHTWWCGKVAPSEIIVETALINMYGKCRRVDDARGIFDNMEHHDITSWNAMISGYAQVEHAGDAFRLFSRMLSHGIIPNKVTIICILDACAGSSDVHKVYSCLVEVGFGVDIVLGSSLVNTFCKCRNLHDAFKIFDGLVERNLITWNAMIAGYTTQQHVEEALKLLDAMQDEGINPDRITWSTLLDACAGVDSLAEGECVYNCIIRAGLEYDSSVAAAAIKFYGNYGNFTTSYILFAKIPQKTFLLWNTLIMIFAQNGLMAIACELFHDMLESGMMGDSQIFADLLSACAKHVAFFEGRWIHMFTILLAMDTDVFLCNALISMYGTCGSLEDAWFLFDRLPERDGEAWTTMIATYAQLGNGAFAVHLYSKMRNESVFLDKVMFISLLKACSKQEFVTDGRNVHKDITMRGFDLDTQIGNVLIDLYGKCGVLDDARSVFENMATWDVVSCNTLITAYAQQNKMTEIVECLTRMEREMVVPDEVTFVTALSTRTARERIPEIMLIHQLVLLHGFESNCSVASALVNVYGYVGGLEEAQLVFNRMTARNVVAFKGMIMGHIEQGQIEDAVHVFLQMQTEGVLVNKASYVCNLHAFASSTRLLSGRHLHACIISHGFSEDVVVSTALIGMYGRCGSLEDGCLLFHRISEKDEVTWAAMLGACVEGKAFSRALYLFEWMLEEAVLPSSVTFLIVVQACSECMAVRDACRLHARLLCGSFISGTEIRNALLSMYGECGNMLDLERLFYEWPVRDVTSYNVMIKNYVREHHPQEALQMFVRMGVEGLIPDTVTFVSCLEACKSIGAYFQGKSVHSCIINRGLFLNLTVCNALISMYSRCEHLQEAVEVFTCICEKNVTSWNAIISAFCQWQYCKKALQMFNSMLSEVLPDNVTFSTVLCACTNQEALIDGKLLHSLIASWGFEQDVIVGNSLITMYGRCGGFEEAETVFQRLVGKTTVTWNAMMMVDTLQGDDGGECVRRFEKMPRSGVSPNEITAVSVLESCASNGMASWGRLTHTHIILSGLESDVSVVTSLVNLYGKCGILKDALSVFKSATKEDLFTWTAMIAAYACLGLGNEALSHFRQMHHKGLVVDRVTLVSIFSACSHTGLLDWGQHLLFQLANHGMIDLQHVDCVIDLLGKMGQLVEAESLIGVMPFQPTIITWTALVGACQNARDVGRASQAATHAFELNRPNPAACIVLSRV